MKSKWLRKVVCAGVLLGAGVNAPASAEAPKDRPFSMRGVELGITLEQFRNANIPDDQGNKMGLQYWCSNEQPPAGVTLPTSAADKADGVVDCMWYSSTRTAYPNLPPRLQRQLLFELFVQIGAGYGVPTFRFLPVDGQLRLFRISVYANSSYYSDILDALTRGYGPARKSVEPFQTKGGGNFTSVTSLWDNGYSSITLVERCDHLERYCLLYDHTAFARIYAAITERHAAAAAQKL